MENSLALAGIVPPLSSLLDASRGDRFLYLQVLKGEKSKDM